MLSMVVVRIVDLRIKEWKGQQKLMKVIPIIFLTIIIQLCMNKNKDVLHTNCIALCMTPNMGQHCTITWLHEKGTFRNKIGHNNNKNVYVYIWTHDTYTKVLGCKPWNNSPLVYTSIMKLLLMWSKQVLWPIFSS